MDFARRQLEKYGWSDGKGLGKHENGISEALKPKLKRGVAGIGHDAAAEFNEHWWEALYDKAATNIQVEEKNGKTKKIKTVDNIEITNSMWHLKNKKKKSQKDNEYKNYFIRKAVLTNDGVKMEKDDDCQSNDDDANNGDVTKMTDEQLFAACGGRTAHKGARHGLKALGKLARIEEQERLMLASAKYKGYSLKKDKNKKDKHAIENGSNEAEDLSEVLDDNNKKKNHIKSEKSITDQVKLDEIKARTLIVNIEGTNDELVEKSKKFKINKDRDDQIVMISNSNKKKKKHCTNQGTLDEVEAITQELIVNIEGTNDELVEKSKKFKINKDRDDQIVMISNSNKKKKKHCTNQGTLDEVEAITQELIVNIEGTNDELVEKSKKCKKNKDREFEDIVTESCSKKKKKKTL